MPRIGFGGRRRSNCQPNGVARCLVIAVRPDSGVDFSSIGPAMKLLQLLIGVTILGAPAARAECPSPTPSSKRRSCGSPTFGAVKRYATCEVQGMLSSRSGRIGAMRLASASWPTSASSWRRRPSARSSATARRPTSKSRPESRRCKGIGPAVVAATSGLGRSSASTNSSLGRGPTGSWALRSAAPTTGSSARLET